MFMAIRLRETISRNSKEVVKNMLSIIHYSPGVVQYESYDTLSYAKRDETTRLRDAYRQDMRCDTKRDKKGHDNNVRWNSVVHRLRWSVESQRAKSAYATQAGCLRKRARTLLPVLARNASNSAAHGAGNLNFFLLPVHVLLLVSATPTRDALSAD